MKVVTISSWLNFGRPAPPGRGSAAGRKFLAPPYYSQRAVFASLGTLFSLLLLLFFYTRLEEYTKAGMIISPASVCISAFVIIIIIIIIIIILDNDEWMWFLLSVSVNTTTQKVVTDLNDFFFFLGGVGSIAQMRLGELHQISSVPIYGDLSHPLITCRFYPLCTLMHDTELSAIRLGSVTQHLKNQVLRVWPDRPTESGGLPWRWPNSDCFSLLSGICALMSARVFYAVQLTTERVVNVV